MNGAALTAAFKLFASGTLWTQFAHDNPGEAASVSSYVSDLAAGKVSAVPAARTKSAQGIVAMLHAAAGDATHALTDTAPVYSGPISFVTSADPENTVIVVDGREVARMGPKASWTLDTTQLANGQHTIQFLYIGAESRSSQIATFQVRN